MVDQAKASGVTLATRTELGKLMLRATDEVAAIATNALERPWPQAINRAAGDVDDRTLRLGLDEYLLLMPRAAMSPAAIRLRHALADHHHAVVDLSGRFTVLEIQGTAVRQTLAAACPLDLHDSAFGIGAATRTVLGKAEIILDRLAADRYRLVVNRSFAPYAEALLRTAAREFGLDG